MTDTKSSVLPYRVDGADLAGYLSARARGRDNTQVQAALNLSSKSLDGIVSAAIVLGFMDDNSGALSERGHQFALASSEQVRRQLILEAMLTFEPYELLFESIAQRADRVTTLDWIETWWNTHGYGSSGSNRSEAAPAFGRLTDFAGLGSYIQGRRGHASRIEWVSGAPLTAFSDPSRTKEPQRTQASSAVLADSSNQPRTNDAGHLSSSADGEPNMIVLNLPLGPGRIVEIRIPAQVSLVEKKRLLQLLEVLITPVASDRDGE